VADSSRKAPLLLSLLSLLFWSSAPLVGASSERLWPLFKLRLQVDRGLPLSEREWSAYRLFRGPATPALAPQPRFLPDVVQQSRSAPAYDLVIHPGASASNRTWPYQKYVTLLNALPVGWKIAIEGLPVEIEPLQSLLTQAGIEGLIWSAGTLRQAIQTLTNARMVFTMDTSFMHFANVLGIPGIALFGSHHPSTVTAAGSIEPFYRVSAPCQPCGRSTCRQPALYCLDRLDPLEIAARLIQKASAGSSTAMVVSLDENAAARHFQDAQ
jgi:heptosyltransferase-2